MQWFSWASWFLGASKFVNNFFEHSEVENIRRATHTFATLCAHVLVVIHVLDVIKEFHFVESLLAVFYYISKKTMMSKQNKGGGL